MPKVICTRPNASNVIDGVDFEPHELGVISVEIDDEKAQSFLRIPGYQLDGDQKPANGGADEDDDLSELQEKAKALSVNVNPRWKRDRLTAEITKAEEAAAEAAKAAEINQE